MIKGIKHTRMFHFFFTLLLTSGFLMSGVIGAQAQKSDVASAEIYEALLAEAADLDQCRNGGIGEPPAPCKGSGGVVGYVNGNAGAENAHYTEGDSIPYRIRFTGLTVGSPNTVVIEYDTTQQGKHAIDYLTSYDRTETVAMGNDPCSDVLTPTQCTNFTTFPIPIDPKVVSSNLTGAQVPGVFTCFGCTITAVSGYSYTGDYSGNSTASLSVTFTANVTNPILAFGGHIATRRDWGPDSSASAIPGSPYHMRVLSLNGATTGQQDRSLNSRAVRLAQATAASVTISGRVTTQSGRGIRNVMLRLVDEQGQVRTVVTSTFGYYRFTDVAAGQTYTISAFAKRYRFEQPAQVLSLAGDAEGINFVANE